MEIGSVSLHRHPLKVQLHIEAQHKYMKLTYLPNIDFTIFDNILGAQAFPSFKYRSEHSNITTEMNELSTIAKTQP